MHQERHPPRVRSGEVGAAFLPVLSGVEVPRLPDHEHPPSPEASVVALRAMPDKSEGKRLRVREVGAPSPARRFADSIYATEQRWTDGALSGRGLLFSDVVHQCAGGRYDVGGPYS